MMSFAKLQLSLRLLSLPNNASLIYQQKGCKNVLEEGAFCLLRREKTWILYDRLGV